VSVPHYHPGEGEEVSHFTKKRDLSQDEHWVAHEKRKFEGHDIPVIMPPRKKGFFEWTITAWRHNFKGIEPVFEGAEHIVKLRHLHINPELAATMGLTEGQMVSIEKKDGPRPGRFNGVVVRITDWGVFRVHLDTDEANALFIKNGDEVDLIYTPAPSA
jgi:putative phosphotransacetylase